MDRLYSADRRIDDCQQECGEQIQETHRYAASALRSAAYTYVMAAVTSLATLAYYVMIYLGRK